MRATVGESDAYVLGTDDLEYRRLAFQHSVWVRAGHDLWEHSGLRAGQRVLDLGCGPGFTTLELARLVGPTGHVVASDKSARFLALLAAECARLAIPWVEPREGPVEALELEPASFDCAYARWLFCWLPDPGAALERVARGLKPGGRLLLQDYLDWAAMSLVPRSARVERVVAACMTSWKTAGGTIDVAAELPELAPRAGLVLESLRPVARLGPVGSLEWRWLEQFFQDYLPKVVARGQLGEDERHAFLDEWGERAAAGRSPVLTPTMADAVLRR
jgi:ubiquinone/menaquinone biosynthesis C-methylase UbiE